MTQWVDYKELRAKLDFAAVLQHYGVKLKGSGPQQQTFCPLPGHTGSSGGKNDGRSGRDTSKRKSPSFSANLAKGIFHCFSCGAKGNVIEFGTLMENLDPKNKDDFRQAALILAERFGIATTPPDAPADKPASRTPAATPNKPSRREAKGGEAEPRRSTAAAKEIVVNAPLDFTLRDLDADHPYLLRERRFTPETIKRFGLGYCSRGLMKGRIAIPLHDADGHLIGYAGRIADDEATSEECPKYLFPSSRERDGTVFEFRKSPFLYNAHAIEGRADDLIVVEGFASVWWLWQNGYRNVVALMGSACSPEQAALIVGLVAKLGHVWVFPDGDDAGTRCVASVFHDVAEYRLFRWVKLEHSRQPTDCDPAELASLLWPVPNEAAYPDVLCNRCGQAAAGEYRHAGDEETLCTCCLAAAHDGSLFEP